MDQVPLSLVIGLDDTWYTKGSHVSVFFFQPVTGAGKSICSIKFYLCQRRIRPNITVIFWGTERGTLDFDKNHTNIMCFSPIKNKAWAKRRVLLDWDNTHTDQISAYHCTKEDGSK